MREREVIVGEAKMLHLFDANAKQILDGLPNKFIITDENLNRNYASFWGGENYIVLPPGEVAKSQQVVFGILEKMLGLGYDRSVTVVGFGGGVVTDIAGFVASIFKRGVSLVQMPTSLLGMVDAALGGKNGINLVGIKNMVGTIYPPQKIVFDYALLQTLPQAEWSNGFAEIIKHACINDAGMFGQLEVGSLEYFIQNKDALKQLIEANVAIKNSIVAKDLTENGDRRLLNFGHTFGHSLESIYNLPHGTAVAVGMVLAARISEEMNGFYSIDLDRLKNVLQHYQLPTIFSFDKEQVWKRMLGDKKVDGNYMQFVLLNKIGQGVVERISLTQLKDLMEQCL